MRVQHPIEHMPHNLMVLVWVCARGCVVCVAPASLAARLSGPVDPEPISWEVWALSRWRVTIPVGLQNSFEKDWEQHQPLTGPLILSLLWYDETAAWRQAAAACCAAA